MSDVDEASVARASARRLRKQEMEEEEMIRESGGDENVMVCIRVRPFNRRELELQRVSGDDHLRSVIEMPQGMGGKVVALEKNGDEYSVVEEFQYTKSFWSISDDQQPYAFAPVTQEDVFQAVGMPVIKSAFAGFHNCVFAYGQTGSGKTFTMMGDFSNNGGQLDGVPGIIPQLCKELFERIARRREQTDPGITRSVDCQLSAIEIYNEQVRDLFWRHTHGRTKATAMKVRNHPTEGAFVDQLTVLKPENWVSCVKMIESGVGERTTAATSMNDESSRSHSVFQIILTQTESVHVKSDDDPDNRFSKPVKNTRISRINLVDLAGSERVKKSGVQGANLKEAAGINQSLSTLKKVIDALVANSKERNPKKHVMIPFRESMLTMLLSHSLGGNSKTTMIACVSPHHDNQEETLLTLRYANRAKGIVNHTRVNEDDAAKKALQLKHEILALQRRLEEGEDDEAEDLKDQVEVGRLALRDLEKENQRLEEEAKNLKSKTKQEEGARFASAFYNSVKTAMLKDQREQLEARIAETEVRIAREQEDVHSLKTDLEKREEEASATERSLRQLRQEEQEHEAIETEQHETHRRLLRENTTAKEQRDTAVELRWAQKLANAQLVRKQNRLVDGELQSLQEANDLALTAVILEAAEQYEERVRKFADSDTQVQNRIRKIEAEIPRLVSKREELDRSTTRMQSQMRSRDREHSTRIDDMETTWRDKYAEMKTSYEGQIHELEQQQYEERRQWDEEIDAEDAQSSVDQVNAIAALETEIRGKESRWSELVASACVDEAERMDTEVKSVTQRCSLRVAQARQRYERRIADLVAHSKVLDGLRAEHETAFNTLSAQVNPLMQSFETIKMAQLLPTSSQEYRGLHATLREYGSTFHSTPIKNAGGEGRNSIHLGDAASPEPAPAASPSRPRQSKIVLPPSTFYPTAGSPSTPRKR